MIDKYDRNSHSVFSLNYHLVLVVKYRKKAIDDAICARLKEIFLHIANKKNYRLAVVEFNHDIDHLHVLFKAQPMSELGKFIGTYKSASSRLIKKEFPKIRKLLWKEAFWSPSFFLATTGGVTLDVLRNYVRTQGLLHD